MSTLLYLFVANPVTTKIIRSFKKNKNGVPIASNKGIVYAIMFLCLLASFTTYTGYLSEKEESYYSLLEIKVSTPQVGIKRAFRKVSLKYHPDKQNDLDEAAKEVAAARFIQIQAASEVLQDSRAREIYDHFGPKAVNAYQSRESVDHSANALIGLGINFAVWGLLTFMLTLSDKGQSRTYSFGGLVAITLVAWQLQLDDLDFLTDYTWYWTKYDKAQILLQLYPAFMRGASIIANEQFQDKEKIMEERIKWIIQAMEVLHEKVDALDGRHKKSRASTAVTAASATSATTATTAVNALEKTSSAGAVNPVKKSKLKKMAATNKQKGGATGKKLEGPQITKAKSFGIPSWAWGIGVYFFINWVLS